MPRVVLPVPGRIEGFGAEFQASAPSVVDNVRVLWTVPPHLWMSERQPRNVGMKPASGTR
jgi:hypothetical protein